MTIVNLLPEPELILAKIGRESESLYVRPFVTPRPAGASEIKEPNGSSSVYHTIWTEKCDRSWDWVSPPTVALKCAAQSMPIVQPRPLTQGQQLGAMMASRRQKCLTFLEDSANVAIFIHYATPRPIGPPTRHRHCLPAHPPRPEDPMMHARFAAVAPRSSCYQW